MFAISRVLAGSARIAVVGKSFVLSNAMAFNSARALATAATPKKTTAASKATATTKKTTTASKTAAGKKTTTTAVKGKTAAAATKKAPVKKTTAAAKKKKRAPAKKTATTGTKRVRKVKSGEEKAAEKMRENVKELKEKALSPPKTRTNTSSWLKFCKQKFAENPHMRPTEMMKDLAEQYRALSAEQRQALDASSSVKKGDLQDELAAWVRKHTPNQIYHANLARAQLRKLRSSENPPYGIKMDTWRPIPDPRLPVGVRTAAIHYTMDRFKQIPKEEQFASLGRIMKEWKELPAAEQKKYQDMQIKDQERYHHEMATVGIIKASAPKANKA